MNKPKNIILLFIVTTLVVSFFESQKIIKWEIPKADKGLNIFQKSILLYAKGAERTKQLVGLGKIQEPTSLDNSKLIENKPEIVKKPEPPFKVLLLGDSFVSVGGGAMLEFFVRGTLPTIEVLN